MTDWLRVIRVLSGGRASGSESARWARGVQAGVMKLPFFPRLMIRFLREYAPFLKCFRNSDAVGKSLPQYMHIFMHWAMVSSASHVGQLL
jgi:hypothetical protein